jgi:hypothetical protein
MPDTVSVQQQSAQPPAEVIQLSPSASEGSLAIDPLQDPLHAAGLQDPLQHTGTGSDAGTSAAPTPSAQPDKSNKGPDDIFKADGQQGDANKLKTPLGKFKTKTDLLLDFERIQGGPTTLQNKTKKQAEVQAGTYLRALGPVKGRYPYNLYEKQTDKGPMSAIELVENYLYYYFKGWLSVPFDPATNTLGRIISYRKKTDSEASGDASRVSDDKIIGDYFYYASSGEAVFWSYSQLDDYFLKGAPNARWNELRSNDKTGKLAKLSKEQGSAVVGYTAGAYQVLNGYLRKLSDKPPRWTQKFAARYGKFPIQHWERDWEPGVKDWVDHATKGLQTLKQADEETDATLYRGISFFDNTFRDEQLARWSSGKTVTSEEFLSFSPDKAVAVDFASGGKADDTKGVVLEVSKSAKATPVSLLSFYEGEKESLFEPSQGLRVKGKPKPNPDAQGVSTIECEEV